MADRSEPNAAGYREDRLDTQVSLPFEDPIAIVIGPLTAHDELLRYFADIHFDRVRHLQPLADSLRADALSRARRRACGLPGRDRLDDWYRILKTALDSRPDDGLSRRLVTLMMGALRGKPIDEVAIAALIFSLREARMPPQIVAGAVKRAFTRFRTKPSAQAFLRLCDEHRAEVKGALDQVTRTMGLRRDAEKVAAAGIGRA